MIKKKIRLKDIAEKAGVSITAVSAVYNNNPDIKISDEMQEHIGTLLRKANYSARKKSASRFSQKPLCVRVLTNFPVDYNMRGEILAGIEERLLAESGKMLVSESKKALTLLHEDTDVFLRGVDGVIFISRIDEKSLATLKSRNFPVAVVGTGDIRDDVNMIYPQYYEYIPKSLDYLTKLGHKNITFVTGPLPHYCFEKSILFFKEYVQRTGLSNPTENICVISSSEETYKVLKDILARKNRPTAIVGQIAFYKGYIESLGFKVPENISMVCFDVPGSEENPVSFFGTDNMLLGAEGVEIVRQRRKQPCIPITHVSMPIVFNDHKTCAEIT